MKLREICSSSERPLLHSDPTRVLAMTSAMNAALIGPHEDLNLMHKLRKPLVEKLRRERINSSIEQLKSLLGPEFLKQQPDSKVEKADILEMTVNVLAQLLQQNQKQKSLQSHFNTPKTFSDSSLTDPSFSPLSPKAQTSISKDKILVNSALWRPW